MRGQGGRHERRKAASRSPEVPARGRVDWRRRAPRHDRTACTGGGHLHAADRQRRAPAGTVPAKAPADRPDQPATAARDAVGGLQRRRRHAERRLLRPLSPRRHSDRHRSGNLPDHRQRQGEFAAVAVPRRSAKIRRDRVLRRQPVLRQQPRLFRSPRRRRPARQRRDGQRKVARRAAEDRAREGRHAGGREAGKVRRTRRSACFRRHRISSRRSTSTTRRTAK